MRRNGPVIVEADTGMRGRNGTDLRWCERAEAGAHNNGPAEHLPPEDEVILADFDREDASPSRPSGPFQAAPIELDWPGNRGASSNRHVPGPSSGFGERMELPGAIGEDASEVAERIAHAPLRGHAADMPHWPQVPGSFGGNDRGNGPTSPGAAAFPGTASTMQNNSAPLREVAPMAICSAASSTRKNKRIVYSDPVVSWGFGAPAAIRTKLRT